MNIKKIVILFAVLVFFLLICPEEQVVPEITYEQFTTNSKPNDLCEARVKSLLLFAEKYSEVNGRTMSMSQKFYVAELEDGSMGVVAIIGNKDYPAMDEEAAYVLESETYDPTLTEPLVLKGEVMEMPEFGVETQHDASGRFSINRDGADDPETQLINELLKDVPVLDTSYSEPEINQEQEMFRIWCIVICVSVGVLIIVDCIRYGVRRYFSKSIGEGDNE